MRTILGVAACFLAFQVKAAEDPNALHAFRECEYFQALFLLSMETPPQFVYNGVQEICGEFLKDSGFSVDRAIDAFMPTYSALLAKHKQMYQSRDSGELLRRLDIR